MAQVAKNYGLVNSVEQFEKFVDRLIENDKTVAFDIETGYEGNPFDGGSLSPLYAPSKVVGFSFTNSTEWARYVPLAHDLGPNLPNAEIASLLWKLLTSVPIVAHNGRFEREFLRKFFNMYIPDEVSELDGWFPLFSDTMIEAYVEGSEPKFGLKALTKSVFNHDQTDLLDLFPGLAKNKSKTLRFNLLDLTPEVVSYACEDAVWCLALHNKYYPIVKDRLIYKTEMEILEVLCHMEKEVTGGVHFDWAAMARSNEELKAFILKYNDQIMFKLSEMTGEQIDINLGSPAQLRDVLFIKLGMHAAKTTDSGLESTGAVALEGLSKKYPVVRQILDYKEQKRLQGTFLEKYPRDYTFASDGYTHPSFLQAFVPSGRFSCSSPNVQQLPKKYYYELAVATEISEKHKEAHGKDCSCPEFDQLYPSGSRFKMNFRDMVIAKPDHYIFGFDYSQIELRVLAGLADEPYLIDAFNEGKDIHSVTAALMFNIALEEVTEDFRNAGKTLGFALVYGLTIAALAARLGISKEEAEDLYNKYFSSFSNIASWMDKVVNEGRKNEYVVSKFGRVNKIWEFQSHERWIYAKGERLCVNALVQGAAADYAKIAMVRQHKALIKAGMIDKVHLMMNVHDALEYYIHDSVDPIDVMNVLLPAVVFPVPGLPKLKADWHIGMKLGSMHKIKFEDDVPIIPEFRTSEVVVVSEKEIHAPDSAESFTMTDSAARAIAEWSQGGASPQRITIYFQSMPDVDSYKKFMVKFKNTPGSNIVNLATPQGELLLPGTTGLSKAKDKVDIELLFPGCDLISDDYEIAEVV